jgi:multimeric flavodoxin WrbA
MKIIIHDLKEEEFKDLSIIGQDDALIISDDGTIHNCIGCFGCWIKTPGTCVIKDKYQNLGEHFSKCDEIIIISKCLYGGFSFFVKNVMDRSISYNHPYFVIRNEEMHHRRRYNNNIDLSVYFYGDNITESEKQTAEKLIKANSINLDCSVKIIKFVNNIKEINGFMLMEEC